VYHRVGGVPKVGDEVRVADVLTLTVESTDGRRVGKVLVVRDVADVAHAGAGEHED